MQASPECVEKFVESYVGMAMDFSYTDDDDQLSAEHDESDIDPKTLAAMRADCVRFLLMIPDELAGLVESNPSQFACGFHLTRDCGKDQLEYGFQWTSCVELSNQTIDTLNRIAETFSRDVTLSLGDDGIIRGA